MKGSGKHHFKRTIALVLIFTSLTFSIGLALYSKYLRPRIISVSQSFAENEISDIVDREIQRLMLKEFLSYDKLTIINRDSEGRVTSISTNSLLLNEFANDLDITIGNIIDNNDRMENGVYLFSLIGADLFSGFGPKIPIRFQTISVTTAEISHSFEEAGINQTLHTITLLVSIDVEILLPFAYSTMKVESKMPVAQTIIVGTVPNAYLNRK